MLSVANKPIVLIVIMLNAVMLSVVMPSVMAPRLRLRLDKMYSPGIT